MTDGTSKSAHQPAQRLFGSYYASVPYPWLTLRSPAVVPKKPIGTTMPVDVLETSRDLNATIFGYTNYKDTTDTTAPHLAEHRILGNIHILFSYEEHNNDANFHFRYRINR